MIDLNYIVKRTDGTECGTTVRQFLNFSLARPGRDLNETVRLGDLRKVIMDHKGEYNPSSTVVSLLVESLHGAMAVGGDVVIDLLGNIDPGELEEIRKRNDG